jgi:AcrR family transcriptional regulator
MSGAPDVRLRDLAAGYSPAQRRTLDAALALFAVHGVGGTSLQMIADSLGVTKAAVYHQLPTKDAIVAGVLHVQLAPLEEAVEEAEAAGGGRAVRERLLGRVLDQVVGHRRDLSTLQSDPVLVRHLGEDGPSRRLWARLFEALLGPLDGPEARVRAAVLSATIGSVAHPFVIDVDDDELRARLLALTARLLR